MDGNVAVALGNVRNQVSAAEWQARTDLAACYRLVNHYGMDEMVANHISCGVPGEHGTFLLNPYGYLYDQMTASCFVKVDESGATCSTRPGWAPTRRGLSSTARCTWRGRTWIA